MQTVKQSIDAAFWDQLDAEIAGIEADSIVGEACVHFLNDIAAICSRVYAEDGGAVEPHYVEVFKTTAYRQVNCWYYG